MPLVLLIHLVKHPIYFHVIYISGNIMHWHDTSTRQTTT
jgi:hypothetical protein